MAKDREDSLPRRLRRLFLNNPTTRFTVEDIYDALEETTDRVSVDVMRVNISRIKSQKYGPKKSPRLDIVDYETLDKRKARWGLRGATENYERG